eukprot:TRINITY_DN8748_c0_g3_i1.p1 TRINITY_DN8748_c0_g3~~TRINITY_DN8748_c0_g3_i1.p1  ORF type:complete len:111 (-),score=18.54 TRINITY_DN8748_c0_g3_i1:489-782(-)
MGEGRPGVGCIFGRVAATSTLVDELTSLHKALTEELAATPCGRWNVEIAFKQKHASKKSAGGVRHNASTYLVPPRRANSIYAGAYIITQSASDSGSL